jgi:hypothetical protein
MGHEKELLSGFSRWFERIFLLFFSFGNPLPFCWSQWGKPRPYHTCLLPTFYNLVEEGDENARIAPFRQHCLNVVVPWYYSTCYYTFAVVVSTIFLLNVSYHKKLLILSGVIPDVPFFTA